MHPTVPCLVLLLVGACPLPALAQTKDADFQYRHADIQILAASASEARAAAFSLAKAARYIEDGARAWAGDKGCVSCHTTGSYLRYRPGLTPSLGKPSPALRDFFVGELKGLQETDRSRFRSGTRTAQAVYIAAGLSEWDAHVRGEMSPETEEALRFMFELQQEDGAWQSLDCWPPYESSAYQEATVAAMAAATAPGWLDEVTDPELTGKISRMKTYLRETVPPHDYARALKLWAATRMPGLLPAEEKTRLMDVLWGHQRPDGGWSIRTFAQPEQWGSGNRAGKLRQEPEFADPPSDGHMTGLAVLILREAGVPARDERIQKAVGWLKSNQRESGRWWTRSLNTDTFHFITYSGTLYPLLALMKCGELPGVAGDQARAGG